MDYTAELIAVGTELLLGNTVNSDARDISEALSGLGINVYFHTVVGDNPERLKSAVEIARNRADIIITTGGLGPTYDDLTKQTLAECFGRKLVFNEKEAERIRGYFEKIGNRKMTENNLNQAWFPENCEILENPLGTAPGCVFESDGKHVLMLPGPPRECREMLRTGVVPYLSKLSEFVIVSKNINIFGIGESAVEDKLRDLMLSLDNPTLAPYAKTGEVCLRVTAKTKSREEAEKLIAPVIEKVQETLGDYIYGTDVANLEDAVLKLMTEKGLTLSAAESCTGGLFSKRLTDIPGASKIFFGSVTAYSNDAKTKILSVPSAILDEYGAVSEQTASAMASGVRALFGTDFSVAITGIAGPASDNTAKEVGTVFVSLDDGSAIYVRELKLGRERDRIREIAVHHAFDMIRRCLTGVSIDAKRLESV